MLEKAPGNLNVDCFGGLGIVWHEAYLNAIRSNSQNAIDLVPGIRNPKSSCDNE